MFFLKKYALTPSLLEESYPNFNYMYVPALIIIHYLVSFFIISVLNECIMYCAPYIFTSP